MDGSQVRQLKPELGTFLKRYLPLFGRDENHEHAQRFVHGLLGGQERRNTENIAEATEGGVVRTMQKFIAQAVWDDFDVLREVRKHVIESLGDEAGTVNVDETGFAKKGEKSVGVKRQYSGTLGRVENCQVGVFANYCSWKGHTMLDRRLFLPVEWADDAARREEAGVPSRVIFRSKPELALEMLHAAMKAGVPFQWVGGDCVYGDSPTFAGGVRALGKRYVLDVSSEARVWLTKPQMQKVRRSGRSKPTTKAISVKEVAAKLSSSDFERITVSEGSQGPILYEYAELTVWVSEEGRPCETAERLLVRRSLGQDPEVKYHRSNAPPDIPLQCLARQRSCRWTIEQDIQASKGECGLDEYETRGWIGWHHHTALSVLALLFLVLQRLRLGEKRASDDRAPGAQHYSSSHRPASLGRGRDRDVVQLADGKKPCRKGMPRTAPAHRTRLAK